MQFEWKTFEGEPYEDVYQFQKTLVEQRICREIPDTLLLGEHPHVITLGRGTHLENLLRQSLDIPVVEIERGGDVTYHGPGQLVGYPILQLRDGECDLHRYLRNLEEVLIRVLAHYGLQGARKPGWTGVWVGERKIASIGVAVRKWVTYHGFALNISTQLECFNRINPCGLPAAVMTSLAEQLPGHPHPQELEMTYVKGLVVQAFQDVFQRQALCPNQESIIVC
jgi:lipoyl(octanoyl) transferase